MDKSNVSELAGGTTSAQSFGGLSGGVGNRESSSAEKEGSESPNDERSLSSISTIWRSGLLRIEECLDGNIRAGKSKLIDVLADDKAWDGGDNGLVGVAKESVVR